MSTQVASKSATASANHRIVKKTVSLPDLAHLVPTHLTRGDRELDGAPNIHCNVRLAISEDRTSVQAHVHFKIKEPKPDYTTAEQTWVRTVYEAPGQAKIVAIDGATETGIAFRGSAGGPQILFPGEDFPSFIEALGKLASMVLQVWTGGAAPAAFSQLVDGVAGLNLGGNRVHVVSTKKHGPVTLFAIVGDTGGADISDDTNGKDDTRIERICFAPMHITLSVPTKK